MSIAPTNLGKPATLHVEASWAASFSPNDGNDVTVGDVPQQVFDLAYLEWKTALDAMLENGSWTHREGVGCFVRLRLVLDAMLENGRWTHAGSVALTDYLGVDEDDALAWLRASLAQSEDTRYPV